MSSKWKNIEFRLTYIEQPVGNCLDSSHERQQQWEGRVNTLKQGGDERKGETVKLQKRIHKKYKKAKADALTGIANRLAYDEKIKHACARWQRNGKVFSLCVIGVDKFKPVNDTWGHKAGDKVSKTIAEVCATNIRQTDFLPATVAKNLSSYYLTQGWNKRSSSRKTWLGPWKQESFIMSATRYR